MRVLAAKVTVSMPQEDVADAMGLAVEEVLGWGNGYVQVASDYEPADPSTIVSPLEGIEEEAPASEEEAD